MAVRSLQDALREVDAAVQVACCFVPTEGWWEQFYEVLIDYGHMLRSIADVLDEKAEIRRGAEP